MDAARNNTANTGDKICRRRNPDDAGRSADDINHIFAATAGADGVPVGVESTDGNRNAWSEPELFGPMGGEFAGNGIRCSVGTAELFANARKKRVNLYEEIFGRQAAEPGVPHPFV